MKTTTQEWAFSEIPDQVDIDAIHSQLASADVFARASYLLDFELKAPKTFLRYRDKYLGGERGWGR